MKKTGILLLFILPIISRGLFAQEHFIASDLILKPAAENIWIHESFVDYPGYGRVGANGLLLVKNGKALLVDTPWNDDQAEALMAWLRKEWGVEIRLVVPTHYHDDNLGGLEAFHRAGIDSLTLSRTREICMERGMPLPRRGFTGRYSGEFEGEPFEIRFPGAGHSEDNTVVYFPQGGVLFAGCLVKSLGTRGLGNTADAVAADWPASLEALKSAYPTASVIIPGHGSPGGMELIDHTLTLFP